MKAIVLAAGTGKRLLPLTRECPKSMVQVLGKPILQYTLDALARKRVSEVILVVGHCREVIRDYFGDAYKGVALRYVVNEDYATTNNIYSLKLGLEHVDEDLILCEGDIVFDAAVLDAIEEHTADNLVFVGRYEPHMNGSVVTYDPETSQISELLTQDKHKQYRDVSTLYKTVNVYYFSASFLRESFVPTLDLYLSAKTMNSYYEVILGALLYMGNAQLHAQVVSNSRWVEIDDATDLELAEYTFSDDKFSRIKQLHGGYWRYDFVDFCYLFNSYFPEPRFFEQLSAELPRLLTNYPSDHGKICDLLARWYKEDSFNSDNLIVGNGACEFIRIFNADVVRRLTLPIPTFNEYESGLAESQLHYVPLRESDNFDLDVDALATSVRESNSNMVIVINPNNPTGRATKRAQIVKLLKDLSDTIVVVDESFIDFTGDRAAYSVQDLVGEFNNLVVLRSISKEFGVPGLRLGYLCTQNNEIQTAVKRRLPIWNINSAAEFFLERFVDFREAYHQSIAQVVKDAKQLAVDLDRIPFLRAIPTRANYVLCEVQGRSAAELTRDLFNQHKILIKDCGNKKPLGNDNYVRIAVKRPQDNGKLLEALHALR